MLTPMRAKPAAAAISVLLVLTTPSYPCTTLGFVAGSEVLVGKNYDWDIGDGMVVVNKRGVVKQALVGTNPARWTSRFGSVTFDQYGREFPSGGMNEAGLVVELMWLEATRYPTDPTVPYGASKLAGERFGLAFWHSYGLDFVAARPFCVYGPGEDPATSLVEVSRYLRWHLNGRAIQVVGDPRRKTRDFIHVSDAVQGLVAIAERAQPGEILNVGSGTEVSMRDLAERIERLAGGTVRVRELTDIQDDTYRLVADISRLRRLGYVPRVPLEQGLADLIEELGDRPGLPQGATIFRRGQKAEE